MKCVKCVTGGNCIFLQFTKKNTLNGGERPGQIFIQNFSTKFFPFKFPPPPNMGGRNLTPPQEGRCLPWAEVCPIISTFWGFLTPLPEFDHVDPTGSKCLGVPVLSAPPPRGTISHDLNPKDQFAPSPTPPWDQEMGSPLAKWHLGPGKHSTPPSWERDIPNLAGGCGRLVCIL